MSPDQAESLLTDENIQNCALVLTALDRLQAEDFNLMEKPLRKLKKFSESDILIATDKALDGYTFMAVPGNGNGTKMTLSVFLRGLQVLGKEKQVEVALSACERFETLST